MEKRGEGVAGEGGQGVECGRRQSSLSINPSHANLCPHCQPISHVILLTLQEVTTSGSFHFTGKEMELQGD